VANVPPIMGYSLFMQMFSWLPCCGKCWGYHAVAKEPHVTYVRIDLGYSQRDESLGVIDPYSCSQVPAQAHYYKRGFSFLTSVRINLK
jgi:hypothetical protein